MYVHSPAWQPPHHKEVKGANTRCAAASGPLNTTKEADVVARRLHLGEQVGVRIAR
jgi:hypothetical protein